MIRRTRILRWATLLATAWFVSGWQTRAALAQRTQRSITDGTGTQRRAARSIEDDTQPEDPIAAELSFNRAILLDVQGNRRQAIQELEQPNRSAATRSAARYYRGILLLETGKLGAAIRELEAAARVNDAPPDNAIYLALAYLHNGEPAKAESAIRSYLDCHKNDRYATFVLAVSLARQRQLDAALVEFDKVGVSPAEFGVANNEDLAQRARIPASFASQGRGLSDPTDEAKSWQTVDDFDELYESGVEPRRWNASVLFAYEFDTNVPLAPQFIGLGSNFIERDDSRAVVASFGEYRFWQEPHTNAGFVWSTFDTFHRDLNEFNVHDYMGGAFVNAAWGHTIWGLRYEFHETLLDSNHFADEHRFVASMSLTDFDWGHWTYYYEYDRIDSNAPSLIPAQFQSANVQALGTTLAFYLSEGDGRIYLGYRYSHSNSDGTDFERTSNMATARFEHPLLCDWMGDVEARYFWDDYVHANSLDFFNNPRFDRRLEVRTGLQRRLTDHLAFRLDYTYVDNNSNVENLFGVKFYEFGRHVVSTQLIYDF